MQKKPEEVSSNGKGVKRKYLEKWNVNIDYADNIIPGEKSNQVLCSPCNIQLTAMTSVIDRHFESEQHLFNTGQIKSTSKFDEEAAIAEIRLAAMTVDRDVSFRFTENCVHILQDILEIGA